MDTQFDLRGAYQQALKVISTFLVAVVMYGVVIEILIWSGYRSQLHMATVLRPVFVILGLVQMSIIMALRGRSLRGLEGLEPAQVARRFRTLCILIVVLCEMVVLYGFILFFVGGNRFDYWGFLAFAVLIGVIFFPRFEVWEAAVRAAAVTGV